VPHRDIEKNQETSADHHSSTYDASGVAREYAGVDLHIRTSHGINSSALEVVCPAPGHREIFQESSASHHSSTYSGGDVAFKSAVINLDFNSTVLSVSVNSATLKKLHVPRQDIEESSGNFCRPSLIHLHIKRCCSRRCCHGFQQWHL
jgi:hypothetical protein